MKSIEPSFKRWFDVIILSAIAVSICLLFSPSLQSAGVTLTNLLNRFRWPAHLVFLSGVISLLWLIIIKLGGVRLSDLRSSNTLRYPPIWIPMLIGSISYVWVRRYVYASSSNEVSLEWLSFAVTSIAILAGIVFTGVCYRVLAHEEKSTIKTRKITSLASMGNDFDALVQDPKKLIEWFKKETPVEDPNEDYFDLSIYARRVAGILRESPLKTIAIAGPYGCGKSSILKMIDFYLFEADQPDGLAQSPENGHSYVNPKKIISCSVSGWGFHEHKIAEYILLSAVKKLSEHVDCVGLADLPSHYQAAISSPVSMWAKAIASLLKKSADPMDVLRQMDYVLSSIGKRLVVYIEDLDRNFNDESFWNEAISLLDRLKDLDHVSFILAIGTPKEAVHANILIRIAEHIEIVPPLSWHQLNTLILNFRKLCLQAFEGDITCQSKEDADKRFRVYSTSGSQENQIEEMLGLNPNRPLNAITDSVMTPRSAKAALRRTWQTWQTLHGEIDPDDLLVSSIIRTVSPQIFTFLNKNINRIRSLGRETSIDHQRQEQTQEREKLNKECSDIVNNAQMNSEAMNLLIEFLFPDWKRNKVFKSNVRQGVTLPSRPTDYWERLTKESLDSREVSDQQILQAITKWKTNQEQEPESLAHSLLEVEGFAEKIEQFGFFFDGHEVRRLAEQLFSLILSQNKRRAKQEEHMGFIELWRLSLDNPVDDHEDWILTQIRLAFPISLRFANDLYYYWHNTDRSMVTIERPQPKLWKGVIDAAKNIYGTDPGALAGAIEPGLHYSLFHLIFLYSQPRYGGTGFQEEDWHWLADIILKVGEMKPEAIIPELVGIAIINSGKGESIRLNQEQIDQLFAEKVPEAIQLLSTEFDESELDEDDRRIVEATRREANTWLREHPKQQDKDVSKN